ncbi:MAG: helix-turn-helix domain-containing protein [Spirochaetaceae bacterium]|nr:helix-turn-helix domain-containing protein [Spirochaetaceae bacterium]
MHGSRHKGRLFYTYLLSFLLILIVPVVFSALVFNRARSILNAEAGRANELLLQQMKSFLDTVMGDVVQLNSMVTNHVTLGGMLFESLPVSNDEYYRAYRIASDLYGYDTSSTGSADLYVYLPKLDMVISPRGYFTTANYQMAQRPLLETGYDAWLGAFSDATAPRFRPSQSMSLSEVVSDTVEMVTPLPAWQRTGTPHGWLVVHVARDLFERIFAETAWTPDSVQLVYHQELGVVASSETVLDPREIEAAGAEALASGVVDRITLGDETYTVSAVRSDVVDWYYVSLVPGSLYAHRFAGLYRYALLALAVGVVIAGLLIYWMASIRYRPIQDLIALVKPDANGTLTLQSDEFALITGSVQNTLREDRRLRQELTRSRPLLLQSYLRRLLRDGALRAPEIEANLRRFGFAFTCETLYLALVEIDQPAGVSRESVEAFLDRYRHRPGQQILTVPDLAGRTGLLVSTERPNTAIVIAALAGMKSDLEEHFGVTSAVGVSDAHSLADVASLLREARAALAYRLVKGGSDPIRFTDVVITGPAYHYPLDDEIRLINSIKAGNDDAAGAILESIYAANFAQPRLSIEMARCLMFDLISTMIKTMDSLLAGEEDAELWARIEPVARLTACRSLERLQQEMKTILTEVCRHVRGRRTSHTEHLRQAIVEYIESHCYERNLGPEAVADHVQRNSAYIGRFFREQFGVGISSYIKNLRVAEAKHLIETTELTVREIAARTGFADSNALIRGFKEHEGVTPGEYKTTLQAQTF